MCRLKDGTKVERPSMSGIEQEKEGGESPQRPRWKLPFRAQMGRSSCGVDLSKEDVIGRLAEFCPWRQG